MSDAKEDETSPPEDEAVNEADASEQEAGEATSDEAGDAAEAASDEADEANADEADEAKSDEGDEAKSDDEEAKSDEASSDDEEAKSDEASSDDEEAKSDEAKSDDEEAKSDEAKSDDEEAKSDEAKSDEAKSDEAKSDEAKSDEASSNEAKLDEPEEEPKSQIGSSEKPPAEPEAKEAPKPGPESLPKSTGEVLIEAENLSKYYGRFTAVENVSFEVRRGQVVAFLGPNGAGKSTTMKILTGVLAPDRGQARIAGLSVVHNRIEVARRLGYLPETGPLYQEMTPIELLNFFGEARGLSAAKREERIRDLVKRLDLDSVRGKAISKLSKGYRQRVGLAQSLLHEPDVLIMDEPTSGLDPNQIRDVRAIIREFARSKAILLSTHILQEVEAIADRVVFISRGRIVFQGDVQALMEEGGGSLDEAFAKYTGVRREVRS